MFPCTYYVSTGAYSGSLLKDTVHLTSLYEENCGPYKATMAIEFHLLKRTISLYVLLKALPQVCLKYTAQGKSRVANNYSTALSLLFATRLSSCIFHTNWQI